MNGGGARDGVKPGEAKAVSYGTEPRPESSHG